MAMNDDHVITSFWSPLSVYTVQLTRSTCFGSYHHHLYLPHSVHRVKKDHRCIGCISRSATLANPGISGTLRNARYSYLALRYSNKRSTSRLHHIDCIRTFSTTSPVEQFHVHRVCHSWLLNPASRELDMPECSEWYRWIDSLHPYH
jgi:hypothetical protein